MSHQMLHLNLNCGPVLTLKLTVEKNETTDCNQISFTMMIFYQRDTGAVSSGAELERRPNRAVTQMLLVN